MARFVIPSPSVFVNKYGINVYGNYYTNVHIALLDFINPVCKYFYKLAAGDEKRGEVMSGTPNRRQVNQARASVRAVHSPLLTAKQ